MGFVGCGSGRFGVGLVFNDIEYGVSGKVWNFGSVILTCSMSDRFLMAWDWGFLICNWNLDDPGD